MSPPVQGAPYVPPPGVDDVMFHTLGAHSTRFLLATFAIIVLLSVVGLILGALFQTDNAIFRDAIRIIGIGGPGATAANGASEAISRWRTTGGNQR